MCAWNWKRFVCLQKWTTSQLLSSPVRVLLYKKNFARARHVFLQLFEFCCHFDIICVLLWIQLRVTIINNKNRNNYFNYYEMFLGLLNSYVYTRQLITTMLLKLYLSTSDYVPHTSWYFARVICGHGHLAWRWLKLATIFQPRQHKNVFQKDCKIWSINL